MEGLMSKIGRKLMVGCAVALFTIATGTAFADEEGDAAAGKKVFNKCKACHSFDPEKKMIGPTLNGVVGRPAGAVEGYKYSKAMANSGLTWDEETLLTYLEKPKAMVPGTKMSLAGIKKLKDRVDVIAYIISMSDSE
jgi:cytochrome c